MTRKTQKKLRKLLTLVCCAVMLVCVTVGATVAYLTSTASVTNTFSVGNVTITLDEQDVKTDGTVDTNTRVNANTYHLLPGHSYIKDPTVHVDDESEDAWLFVKVENGIADIETDYVVTTTNEDGEPVENVKGTIEEQMTALGWTKVAGQTNVWAYKEIVNAEDDIIVFEGFKVDGSKDVANYTSAQVKITAYAVQADGFETAAAALTAAPFPQA